MVILEEMSWGSPEMNNLRHESCMIAYIYENAR